jgi:hypothetical protein
MIEPHYAHPGSLMLELRNPRIWDVYPFRRGPQSPHRELSDIWVRYNAIGNLGPHFNDEHESEWYEVVEQIPSAKEISERIARDFNGKLGGVLITKIPPGKQCYPHIDQGWHARYYEKFAYQVQGNTEQTFHVEENYLHTRSGDLFWFDNSHTHWVENPSMDDRITLIVCLRRH